jgi:hypothetical protein
MSSMYTAAYPVKLALSQIVSLRYKGYIRQQGCHLWCREMLRCSRLVRRPCLTAAMRGTDCWEDRAHRPQTGCAGGGQPEHSLELPEPIGI